MADEYDICYDPRIYKVRKLTRQLAEANATIERQERELAGFRKILFLHHGCNGGELYGDDGEMQCHKCGIDFKRDSAEQIKGRFFKMTLDRARAELDVKGDGNGGT